MIPESQTSSSVQFDQVLTSLQAPVREDLQIFLKEFGDALDKYGGAEGFQESFRTSPAAYQYTSQVNQALLGTQPGDLAGFVSNLDIVVRELNREQADLQDLITNLDIGQRRVRGQDQASLREAIVELPQALAVGRPALAKLNRDFPPLRAFSREALPGVQVRQQGARRREPVDRAAPRSWSRSRSCAAWSRTCGPRSRTSPRSAAPRCRSSSSPGRCPPASTTSSSRGATRRVPNNDAIRRRRKVYKETGYGLIGVAGESRSGDANGQWFRVLGGGGTNTIAPFSTPDLPGPLTGVSPVQLPRLPARQAVLGQDSVPSRRPVRDPGSAEPQQRASVRRRQPDSSGKSATAGPPAETPLVDRYASILTAVRQGQEAARRRVTACGEAADGDRSLPQFAAWSKDWTAFQQANGIDRRACTPPKRAAADAQGDPRPPARLHRHRRPAGGGAARDLHHRPEPAPADPAARGEAVRAEGRDDRPRRPSRPARARRSAWRASASATSTTSSYENGHAVVTMAIDRKFLPVYKNATILLRPKTGLKDMFLELDPGTNYDPTRTTTSSRTATRSRSPTRRPDTNVDQILAALDGDTRAYLRLLLVGGGQGLNGRGKDLGKLLGSLGPINRGLARLNTEVAKRKDEPRHADPQHEHALGPRRRGRPGHRAARLRLELTPSERSQARTPDVERTVALLGPTLRTTSVALAKTDQLATVLGPAINSLRPFARKLKPVNDSLGHLAKTTYRARSSSDIRPFVRDARAPVREPAARRRRTWSRRRRA